MDDKEFINLGNGSVISKAAYLEAFKKCKDKNLYYNGKEVGYNEIDENGYIKSVITDDKVFKEFSNGNVIGVSSRYVVDVNENYTIDEKIHYRDELIIKNNESND